MKDNGTDRDVALLILSGLDSCATLVATINDNLYVPHIVTQPTDQEGALGDTVTFTVVANNVAEYKWQYKATNWHPGQVGVVNEASYSIPITEQRLGYEFRCQITGKDGSVIYTDSVKMILSEAQG